MRNKTDKVQFPIHFRMQETLRSWLERAAKENGASMNGEILERLKKSFEDDRVISEIRALRREMESQQTSSVGQLPETIEQVETTDGRLWLYVSGSFIDASEADYRHCEFCTEPFVVGAGTGRRTTARYCSARCRKDAWLEAQTAKAG